MEKLVQKLKDVTGVTDVASLSNTNPAAQLIGKKLGVCFPTIKKWITGENTPHKAMLPCVFDVLDEVIELKELMKDAPWNQPSICRQLFKVTEVE